MKMEHADVYIQDEKDLADKFGIGWRRFLVLIGRKWVTLLSTATLQSAKVLRQSTRGKAGFDKIKHTFHPLCAERAQSLIRLIEDRAALNQRLGIGVMEGVVSLALAKLKEVR